MTAAFFWVSARRALVAYLCLLQIGVILVDAVTKVCGRDCLRRRQCSGPRLILHPPPSLRFSPLSHRHPLYRQRHHRQRCQITRRVSPVGTPRDNLLRARLCSPRVNLRGSPRASPQGSPRVNPLVSPRGDRLASLLGNLQGNLLGNPQASHRGSPRHSLQGTQPSSRRADLRPSPRDSPHAGLQGSLPDSPRVSPLRSPRHSRLANLQSSLLLFPRVSPRLSLAGTRRGSPPQNQFPSQRKG